MNAADQCGTPQADAEFAEFHQRFGAPAHSAFLYHYARLIEIVHALEKIEMLLADPRILDKHVRATAGVNSLEGVGMIEAPRGTLIHHYKVDEEGAITWANLIVATGHNNLAMGRSVQQVSEHFIDGNKLQEGMLNRVSAVVRAYDPCLSCSTHAIGDIALRIQLLDAEWPLARRSCHPIGITTLMDTVLIVGYGNHLRSDDGLGFRAAEILSRSAPSPGLRYSPAIN